MTTAQSLRPADRERINAAAADARARAPAHLDAARRRQLSERAASLLAANGAVLIAHYYVDDSLQDLADATGGCVADSLEMARFGADHAASTLVVAGVRFMGETAKILSPDKRVLLLDTDAECSLDLGCPADRFSAFCDAHPDRTVVVYANTSAAVKARADWVVTSSVALPIVRHLHERGEKILWAPDRYLGDYVQRETGVDMLMWDGSCVVHEEFKASELAEMKAQYPDARILVHPESPPGVIALADVVGSTSGLIRAVKEGGTGTYIVATEDGIFHRMHQVSPGSRILAAPTAGRGATCKSCAHCPWMKLNDLRGLIDVLENPEAAARAEVHVEEDIRVRAVRSLRRMLDFARTQQPGVPVAGNA